MLQCDGSALPRRLECDIAFTRHPLILSEFTYCLTEIANEMGGVYVQKTFKASELPQ
jgi:hypothetical protein